VDDIVAFEGAFFYCVFSQELRLGVLPSLPKGIGSSLTVGPNAFGSRFQARPKTFPKSVNSWVWLKTLQKRLGLAAHVVAFTLYWALSKRMGVDTDILYCGRHCRHKLLSLWTTL